METKNKKPLNNTQKLSKAIKNLEALGVMGTTIFIIESWSAIEDRLKLLKDENNTYQNAIYSRKTAIKALETYMETINPNNL